MKFSAIDYRNATAVKFDNRRVSVEIIDNGGFGLCFKRICTPEEVDVPSALHEVVRGKLKITKLRISRDAALALYHSLQRILSLTEDTQQLTKP